MAEDTTIPLQDAYEMYQTAKEESQPDHEHRLIRLEESVCRILSYLIHGDKVVPIEPTDVMIKAGLEAVRGPITMKSRNPVTYRKETELMIRRVWASMWTAHIRG